MAAKKKKKTKKKKGATPTNPALYARVKAAAKKKFNAMKEKLQKEKTI